MDKSKIQGLIFYFEHSAELDPGIQGTTLEVLGDFLDMIEEQEAAAAKKRKSPNKSGVLQIDPKEGKSGIGDALNKRTRTRKAYGYQWCFKDEYDAFLKEKKG